MEPAKAFSRAWDAVAYDIDRYIANGVLDSMALAQIQADLADSLRRDLPQLDDFARENIILSVLKQFRTALTVAGAMPDHIVRQQARRAVAKGSARTTAHVHDLKWLRERREKMQALADMGETMWKWKSRLDSLCCVFCLAMHGTVYGMGVDMDSHPNCRCTPTLVSLPLVDGLDWLMRRSDATLIRMVGPTRAGLLRSGRSKPEDLIDPHRKGMRLVRDFRGPLEESDRPGRKENTASTAVTKRTKVFPKNYDVEFIDFKRDPATMPDEKMVKDFIAELFPLIWNDQIKKRGFKDGSTWNGRVDILRDPSYQAHATKEWSSSITIAEVLATGMEGTPYQPASRGKVQFLCTVYHEFLHSVSKVAVIDPDADEDVGAHGAFIDDKGIEEGVAHMLTHLWSRDIAEAMGLADDWDILWMDYPIADVYVTWERQLLKLAELLEMDPGELGLGLMQLPLGGRVWWLSGLVDDRIEDDEKYAKAIKLVDGLLAGGHKMYGWMNT